MAEDTGHDSITAEWITLDVSDGTKLPAYVARPTATAKAGLMVFQDAFGVNEHIRDVTERFARAGYLSVAPALFHRTDPKFEGTYTDFAPVMPHMQAITDEGLAADITATFNWLKSPAGGNTSAVGSIGYCMGGRASFLADATVPVSAAVSYYGGGIAPAPNRKTDLLGRAPDISAPILLIWGGLDGHIGPEQRNAVEAALTAAGKDFVNVVFSKADHGFFCDARASYNPCASNEAQALTLAFLATNLK